MIELNSTIEKYDASIPTEGDRLDAGSANDYGRAIGNRVV
jgi:hypothetical protein